MASNNNKQDTFDKYNLSKDNKDHQNMVSLNDYYQKQLAEINKQLKYERERLNAEQDWSKLFGSLVRLEDNKQRISELEDRRAVITYDWKQNQYDMRIAGLENTRAEKQEIADGKKNAIYDHELSIEKRQESIEKSMNSLRQMGYTDKEIESKNFDRLGPNNKALANKQMEHIENLQNDITRFEQLIKKAQTERDSALLSINDINGSIKDLQLQKNFYVADHQFNVSWDSMAKMKAQSEALYKNMENARKELESTRNVNGLLNQWKQDPLLGKINDIKVEQLEKQYAEAKRSYDTHMVAAQDVYENLQHNAMAYKIAGNELNATDPNRVQFENVDQILSDYNPNKWNGGQEQEKIIDINALGESISDGIINAAKSAVKGVENVIDLDSLDQKHDEKQWDKGFWRNMDDRNAAGLKELDTDIKDPGFEKDLDDHNFRDR